MRIKGFNIEFNPRLSDEQIYDIIRDTTCHECGIRPVIAHALDNSDIVPLCIECWADKYANKEDLIKFRQQINSVLKEKLGEN